jgi:chromate transporter
MTAATSVTSEERLSPTEEAPRGSALEVLAVAGRLGVTCFGGPVAHLGYFRDEYVKRRNWVDEETYADLIALCQTLPGPASSQVGISLGIIRAGLPGGIAAWLGFTLPSAIAMVLFASVLQGVGPQSAGWLNGLKVVAVAVVALAVWGMARSLAPDRPRATMAILAAIALLIWPSNINIAVAQIGVIVIAGLIGWRFLPAPAVTARQHTRIPITRAIAVAAWIAFFVLLFGLPVLRAVTQSQAVALVDSFYRVGSLVFGGGHVVLPLLQAEVIPNGWVTPESFLAGYGAAQAVPGPLFTFSAFLGAVTAMPPNGVLGATLALLAIYVPSFLLLIGTLPSWGALRVRPSVQSALRGINAAVVGLLLSALYQSGWSAAIRNSWDFALGVAAFGLLAFWGVPPWLVVVITAAAGAGLTALGVQ